MSILNEVFSNLCLIILTSRYGAKNIQDLEFFFYKCKIKFGKLTWIAYTVYIWMLYNTYVCTLYIYPYSAVCMIKAY